MTYVTVGGRDAQRILHNARLFAAEDDLRPVLMGVRLVVADRVWAIGANPFALGWDSAETADGDGAFALTLPREVVDFTLRELKTYGKKLIDEVSVVISDQSIVIGAAVLTYKPVEGDYPDYRQVIPGGAGEATPNIAIAPWMVGMIEKVRSDTPVSRWTFRGPIRPIEVEIGETFKAVLMPLRAPDTRAVSAPPIGVSKPVAA